MSQGWPWPRTWAFPLYIYILPRALRCNRMKITTTLPRKTPKDPNGGSYPAYPSGKSWDAASGKTGSGKKLYHNIIPVSSFKTEAFYVAIITPVIFIGVLEIDVDSLVVDANGKAIPGLYAVGEVAGGVHGNIRLGGNSLLDCVDFGRVAGTPCAKYMIGDGISQSPCITCQVVVCQVKGHHRSVLADPTKMAWTRQLPKQVAGVVSPWMKGPNTTPKAIAGL